MTLNESKARILVVDDEEGMLEVCADTLKLLPSVEVILEPDSLRAVKRLAKESYDLLIADIMMPNLNGVELLRRARERDTDLAALIITAHPSVETAVECMKLNAADYITEPFLPEDLLEMVKRLLKAKILREENRLLKRQVERHYVGRELLGNSAVMQRLRSDIQRVARTDLDVLIIGETGTGKELVARALHQHSLRKTGPFVPVDCGAIPEQLLEREFFGHERGAFTGAHTRSIGLLEYAKGGTFFLDEIGQLPLSLQAKLLRVLQERVIRRVGGTKEIPIDVRLVAATSLDLEEEIQHQCFRLDLYHRINVVRLDLPPLRERSGDVQVLAEAFMERFVNEYAKGAMTLSAEALEVLQHYDWPGNVRELQNVIKRAVALATGDKITVDELPDTLVVRAERHPAQLSEGGFFDLRERRIAAFEKQYLRDLLQRWSGDVASAAKEARLPRGSLYDCSRSTVWKHAISGTKLRPSPIIPPVSHP